MKCMYFYAIVTYTHLYSICVCTCEILLFKNFILQRKTKNLVKKNFKNLVTTSERRPILLVPPTRSEMD